MGTPRTRKFVLAPAFLLLVIGQGPHAEAPADYTITTGQLNLAQTVALESIADAPSDYQKFEATAYCVYGITYSGVRVERGIVAADPRVLPIGSVIEIQAGDYTGIYTVMDTGGLIKGEIIDIYMPDYEEAIQFGRQQVRLRVLRRGWAPDTSDLSVAG